MSRLSETDFKRLIALARSIKDGTAKEVFVNRDGNMNQCAIFAHDNSLCSGFGALLSGAVMGSIVDPKGFANAVCPSCVRALKSQGDILDGRPHDQVVGEVTCAQYESSMQHGGTRRGRPGGHGFR